MNFSTADHRCVGQGRRSHLAALELDVLDNLLKVVPKLRDSSFFRRASSVSKPQLRVIVGR
jgi:hypothetical protein